MSGFGFEPVCSCWGRTRVEAEKSLSGITRGVFPRHTWPHFSTRWVSTEEGQHNPVSPDKGYSSSMPPIRKVLPAFVQVTALKVQMEECFRSACPNLGCWDISSPASPFRNDILVQLIQPHPYKLKILILPWCLHISNICSPLKRYPAHGEIEVHIWKT